MENYNLSQLGTLTPEQFAQQQQLNRQQQMAQALMQQSQQPQGQMISGRYVAPSWAQQLAPLANIAASKYIGEKADTQAAQLAQQLREGRQQEQAAIMDKVDSGDLKSALRLASSSQYGTGKDLIPALIGNVIPKTKEDKVVPKGGVLIGADGKVVFRNPGAAEGEGGLGLSEGRFNKKGDYIAPGGVFIGKSEVAKDREIARAANELREGLQQLKPADIKATETVLGDVTQSGFKKYIASQLGNPALSAQTKVNTSSVMQTLQNLPPGPASDKDIMQAKSSFPGYGDAKALQEWVDNTNALLERKISNVNAKYGSEDWYGAKGIPNKVTPPPSLSKDDQDALAWANANPGDARAATIKKRLGVK